MDFEQTGLPGHKMLKDAFNAGWLRFQSQGHKNGGQTAEVLDDYLRGPVALARIILNHGGDCRMVSAAAGLAGPAAFSGSPCVNLNQKIVDLAGEVMRLNASDSDSFSSIALGLSVDARLFLQASAIMFVDRLSVSADVHGDGKAAYMDALRLYGAARGSRDTFGLDTRFEIAAIKAQMALDLPRPLTAQLTRALV